MELQSWTKPLRPFHAANITVIDHDKTNFVSPHGGPHQFNDNVVNNAVTTFGKIPWHKLHIELGERRLKVPISWFWS
jgi:hypothetical protein